jgi:hypothetical protein
MCSVEVVTLESLGARLCEALSTSNHNDNDCSKVEALINSASKSFPKHTATSHVGPSGSQTDFESALAALDAELKNRGTGGLDQDLLLPPELVQNSGSKEFFCYAIAVLIGSINKYPSGLLRTHLRQLERAYGYETEDGDEVFSTRTSTGVARGVSWDEWDGADWMPAASGRRVPDPRSLVVIRADDLDTVMSLLEDLTKEFFDLDDWIKKGPWI